MKDNTKTDLNIVKGEEKAWFALKNVVAYVDIKERQFKSYTKRTYTAKFKVGRKTYKIKQEDYDYGENSYQPGYNEQLHDDWYITTAQMKSIINNNPILIKQTSFFDGMIDCQTRLDGDFITPSQEYINSVLEELSRKDLMRCHYDMKKGIFKLWSCCNDYNIKVEDAHFLKNE